MRRIRRAAPELIGFLLVLLGASLWIMSAAAAPPDPAALNDPHVTFHEMRSFVFFTIGLAGVAVIGGVWAVFASILSRDRQLRAENLSQLTVAVSELGGGLKRAIDALERHNDSPYAHVVASEHNHAPMQQQLDRIETEIDEILRDCAARTCSPRNPSDSPNAKRFSDPPEFDGRLMRGKGKP